MTILGDWGTTRLRLFRLRDGAIAERLDGPGIGQLAASPAETLAAALAPWRDAARDEGVLLCGMAGSRNGLVEVPYAPCPADADAWRARLATVTVDGIAVSVAPGLSGANFTGHADVMRGEETQIFGATAVDPSLARGRALVVLPGTHSKWAELIDGRVERFHTFPTGELFALLRDHSTLTRAGADTAGREQGFADGLARAGTGLIAGLFEARAAQLVEGRSHGWALGLLSGLLIGGEFAEAIALAGGAPSPIVLIGDPALSALYTQTAERFGLAVTHLDGDACAIAGLALLYQGPTR
ncbi:2-dehydro-3-deoxygalactonokinase [uncultured Sphingomonas sp.]|uniref:2-dehydro-3-deoxygalactonokinase n=1 Tax=uncultured Sphingomonas sp. TaxID=158754 RepID=UPI002620DB42|nr:2-dehydro-3-deoxygalactonokinase [uncultured Sphingomonas sp.]